MKSRERETLFRHPFFTAGQAAALAAGLTAGMAMAATPAAPANGTRHSLQAAASSSAYAPAILQSLTDWNSLPRKFSYGIDGNIYLLTESSFTGTDAVAVFHTDGSVTPIYTTSLYSPAGYNFEGLVQNPDTSLIVAANEGSNSDNLGGTLFRVTLDGTMTVLHNFGVSPSPGAVDGTGPMSLIRGKDGNIYGTTSWGGTNNCGTIFKLTPGGKYSNVAQFPDAAGNGGCHPSALVAGTDGHLYVMSKIAALYDDGIISRLNTDGSFTQLHSPANTELVATTLVQAGNGALYGTYVDESSGDSTQFQSHVFKLTTDGQYSVLPSQFVGFGWDHQLFKDGKGNVYGMSQEGGPFAHAYDGGYLYRVTRNDQVQALAFFGYGQASSFPVEYPTAAIIGPDGNLYGGAGWGGANNSGATFKLPLPPPANWGTGPAPTATLTINPSRIQPGQSATLTWSTTNTSTCQIYSVESPAWTDVSASGSLTIKPPGRNGDYPYTLGCANNGLDVIATQRLVVSN